MASSGNWPVVQDEEIYHDPIFLFLLNFYAKMVKATNFLQWITRSVTYRALSAVICFFLISYYVGNLYQSHNSLNRSLETIKTKESMLGKILLNKTHQELRVYTTVSAERRPCYGSFFSVKLGCFSTYTTRGLTTVILSQPNARFKAVISPFLNVNVNENGGIRSFTIVVSIDLGYFHLRMNSM